MGNYPGTLNYRFEIDWFGHFNKNLAIIEVLFSDNKNIIIRIQLTMLPCQHFCSSGQHFCSSPLLSSMKRDENFRAKVLWLKSLSTKYKTSVCCPRHKIDFIRTLWTVEVQKSNWRNQPSLGKQAALRMLWYFKSKQFLFSTRLRVQCLIGKLFCF